LLLFTAFYYLASGFETFKKRSRYFYFALEGRKMTKEKDYIGYGIIAFILGIIALFLILFDLYFMARFITYLYFELPAAVLAMLLGLMAYWGKHKDKFVGLAAIIVGFLVFIAGIITIVIYEI